MSHPNKNKKSGLLSLTFLICCISIFSAQSFAGFSGGQAIASTGEGSGLGIFYSQAPVAPNPPGGLGAPLRFYVEVPQTAGAVEVRIFDPNLANSGAAAWDFQVGASFDTPITYSVRDPSGTLVGQLALAGGSSACAGCADVSGTNCSCDSGWWSLALDSTPMAGHYEIEIDSPSGDDVNRFAIWTLDPVNNVELNTYAESFVSLISSGGATYTGHPYVTEGCSVALNNFDMDDVAADAANLNVTSRSGASINVLSLSGNAVWLNTNVNFSEINDVDDYGIWTNDYSFLGNLNPAEVYASATKVSSTSAPTAQPSPDGARWYLQTTAAGTPAKPFAAQFVRDSSGPNPPVVGQTTRVVVTLRFVNPTAFPVTFSAPSNLYNTTIPGGEVLYAGSSLVSQGSIVSEPSVGGSGSFSWNPGTVAAGATVIASYALDITPVSSAGNLQITSGTTLSYLDETGATNPGATARATQSFGPLCPLEMSFSVLTYALIHDVKLRENHKKEISVEWETAAEVNTKAFKLEYFDASIEEWKQMNNGPLAAMNESGLGGHYRFVLSESLQNRLSIEKELPFRIVELDFAGKESIVWDSNIELESIEFYNNPSDNLKNFSRTSLSEKMSENQKWLARINSVPSIQANSNKNPLFGHNDSKYFTGQLKDKVYIHVAEQAFVEISNEDLSKEFQVSVENIKSVLEHEDLRISHHDEEISWQKSEKGIIFYAFAKASNFSSESPYLIEFNTSGTYIEQKLRSTSVSNATYNFVKENMHHEKDVFAGTAISTDPSADFWFWKVISTIDGLESSQELEFLVDDIAVEENQASVTLSLQGASTMTDNKHRVNVMINGTSVADINIGNFEQSSETFDFDANILNDGINKIVLKLNDESNSSIVYLNSFDITYARSLKLSAKHPLYSNLNAGKMVLSNEMNGKTPSLNLNLKGVYDLQNPYHPVLISKPQSDVKEISLTLGEGEHDVFTLFEENVSSIYRFSQLSEQDVTLKDFRSDLLIVSPRAWFDTLHPLIERRKEEGLDVVLMALEDVFHGFTDGEKEPKAIEGLLASMKDWTKAPRYLLLVGTGSFDYRDVMQTHENILPVKMKNTPHGLLASDQFYLENGHTLSIGRFNAQNRSEVQTMVMKTLAYENASTENWRSNALSVADNSEQFEKQAQLLQQQFAFTFPQTSHLKLATQGTDELRKSFIDELNKGQSLVSYSGHGGFDRLSSEGIFRIEDIQSLKQESGVPKPFVLTAFSCSIGRFAFPGFDSLGAALLKHKDGAVAVWSPSGLSEFSDNQRIAQLFSRKVSTEERLGDAIIASLKPFNGQDKKDLLYIASLQLLGDPSLKLKTNKNKSVNDADSKFFENISQNTQINTIEARVVSSKNISNNERQLSNGDFGSENNGIWGCESSSTSSSSFFLFFAFILLFGSRLKKTQRKIDS